MATYFLITVGKPVFKKSTQGNPILVVDGYRFCKHRVSGMKTRWICPSSKNYCPAVVFTVNDEIVTSKGVHNHPRNCCTFENSRQGNPMLVFDGYRYTKHHINAVTLKTSWYCCYRYKKCLAAAYTINDDVIRLKNEHNHQKFT
ncbi:hypothetical protein ABMA28_001428 [Loxostege sticticalis]|uniref:FLYWCH-type domain-containing protein n=1 Tax=Loxostege sticticalis TaxID=481309 RepID=A0ABD0T1M4_LOXSC